MLFIFFFLLSGECSLGAHGLLSFRTNDVLLGTSGVGCAYLLCLIPPVMCYGYRSLIERSTSRPSSTLLTSAVGRSVVEWLPDRIGSFDPYNFFTPERAQFCSGAPPNSKSRPHT